MKGFLRITWLLAALLSVATGLASAETTLILLNNGATDMAKFYAEMIPIFEKEHPGVTIQISNVAGSDIASKIRTVTAAGGQLDLVEIWGEAASQFYADGIFVDLNPYLNTTVGLREKLVKSRMEAFTWEGKLFGIPANVNPEPVYYNADMLGSAGLPTPAELGKAWNWDTFLQQCKRLSRDTNGDGTNDFWTVKSNPAVTDALPWLVNAGGSWFDRHNNPTKSALTQPGSMKGLKFYTDLFAEHKVALLNANFLGAKVAFTFDEGPFYAATLKATAIKWGMAKRPMGPANDGSIVLGTGFSIARATKNPDLAWEWIKFVNTRTEPIRRLYELTSRTPAYAPVLAEYAKFMRSEYGQETAPIVDIATNPYNFSGVISPKLSQMGPMINSTLKELFKGGIPLESTIAELERKLNLILQQ